MTPRAMTRCPPERPPLAARVRLREAVVAVFLTVLGFSVPSRTQEVEAREAPRVAVGANPSGPVSVKLVGSLEVGLSGPPAVSADGGWWLVGRDGEIERFRADDALDWSISIAAAVTGAAVTDELGQLLFVPTARDLVVALDPSARVHWRYRAPAGVTGPMSWVRGQGLAFLGRDRALYWLDGRANLVLRAPLNARVSFGPTAFGNKILLGTEDGQLMAFTRQGKRQSTSLDGPIMAIVAAADGAFVLAGGVAHWFDSSFHSVWSRPNVLGIGGTAARGHASRPFSLVARTAAGELEWLDIGGSVIARASSKLTPGPGCAPELAATSSRAWAVDDAGTIWEARAGSGWTPIGLGSASLFCPVVDPKGNRILVGTVAGSIWSRGLEAQP